MGFAGGTEHNASTCVLALERGCQPRHVVDAMKTSGISPSAIRRSTMKITGRPLEGKIPSLVCFELC